MVNLSEVYTQTKDFLLRRRQKELARARDMLEAITEELSPLYEGILNIKPKPGEPRSINGLVGYIEQEHGGRARILTLVRSDTGGYHLQFLNERDANLAQPYIDICRNQGLEIKVRY